MKTTITQRAEADCPSHSRTDVHVRDVHFTIDEPIERDGTNMGPSPTETSLASLMGCLNTISHKCADKLGVDIGHLHIRAACQFDRRGVLLQEEIDLPFTAIDITIEADGAASAADLARVGIETEKYCPLSKLYRAAGTALAIEWKHAGQAQGANG